jgi:AcrR family transcriptional regulator
MSPRPDVTAERRSQILEAATQVFSQMGLDQARMDDIVAASGLSKGALYWYFKSKDEIIAAILDSVFTREITQLQALLAAEGPVYDRLLRFVQHTAADLKAMTHLAPIVYEFYALAFRNEAVRKVLQNDLRRYVTFAEPLIQQGIDRGEFGRLDARQGANALAALIEGTLLLWVIDPASVDLETQIEAAARLFLAGLQVKAPLAAP